ncbi:MAG: GspH/FimT family pseudopilin [bacterium]
MRLLLSMDKGRITQHIQFQRGFTIIEILVVLALMGIAVAIAGPRFGAGMRGTETRTSVQRFASALRAARTIAVAHQARVLAVVELNGNQCHFRIQTERKNLDQRSEENSEFHEESAIDSSGSGSISEIFDEPLTLSGDVLFLDFIKPSIAGTIDRGAVMFLPQGNSTGGSFILGHYDGPKYEVAVDLITGRVHTSRMN